MGVCEESSSLHVSPNEKEIFNKGENKVEQDE